MKWGSKSYRQCRFDRRHCPLHSCQHEVALATNLEGVSAMKWGSKVTASAVSIAAIVVSILANMKWH